MNPFEDEDLSLYVLYVVALALEHGDLERKG